MAIKCRWFSHHLERETVEITPSAILRPLREGRRNHGLGHRRSAFLAEAQSRAAGLPCPIPGGRHLNTMQWKMFIVAEAPRVQCPKCGIKQVCP